MKVLVTPRDPNPYQEMLYSEMKAFGVEHRYLTGPTGSRTLNLALMPIMLAYWRAQGFEILHVHWVYEFSLPWAGDSDVARRAMQAWFYLVLAIASGLGMKIVWTAHNLVPHQKVFHNDVAARRGLIRRCGVVIAHSAATAGDLNFLGANLVKVIPQGSFVGRYPSNITRAEARRRLGVDEAHFVIALVGVIQPYKGASDLITAITEVPDGTDVRVFIAGVCDDDDYRHELESLGAAAGDRVHLRLDHVPDDELQDYLLGADLAVLPFRRITNTSSALLALSFGLPLLVPDFPQLSELPGDAVIRYPPGLIGLAATLGRVIAEGRAHTGALRQSATNASLGMGWDRAARATAQLYGDLLNTDTPLIIPQLPDLRSKPETGSGRVRGGNATRPEPPL